jgi:hypothetical protein
MSMHEHLIKDLEVMNTGVKAHAAVVEKLELKMGRQSAGILKLQQDMRTALKK